MSESLAQGGDAFGLRISSTVAVEGLEPLAQRPTRSVTIDVVGARGALGRRHGQEILYWGGDRKRPQLLIDRRPGGYGVWSPSVGRYFISVDGREIQAALPPRKWPWQLLFAQILPIAAAIQGLEVIHASAVAIRGGVIAVVAPSGAGKSTLAAALVGRGAQFVADDVLALETDGDGVLAHPGAGIANVSTEGVRRGVVHERVVARTSKYHLAVRRVQGPLPLRAVVFLDRASAGRPASIARMATPDPFWLLGSTFVFVVKDRRRLLSQLDLHHRIASSVSVLHARLPWVDKPDALAAALEPYLP